MERESEVDIESLPDIVITRRDRGRLHHVISQYAPILSWPAVAFLVRELRRATIVDAAEIPASTATMHSVVAFRDGESGTDRAAQLAYPGDPALHDGGVCVLTSLGAALLGLSEGQSIAYADPGGRRRTVTVVKLLHQPEVTRPADGRKDERSIR